MNIKIKIHIPLILLFLVSRIGFANDYVDRGFPATDRTWMGQDYVNVYQLINSDRSSLPDFSSKDGKAIIKRLTDTSNFEFCKDKSLPIGQRLQNFLQVSQASNSVMMLYATKLYSEQVYAGETADMLAFSLYLAEVGIDLMNEFIPTIPKDDQYEVRMQGVKQMFSGITTQVSGAEVTLTEKETFSAENRLIILEAIHATLPKLKVAFSNEFKKELSNRFEKQKQNFEETQIVLIEEIIKELEPVH